MWQNHLWSQIYIFFLDCQMININDPVLNYWTALRLAGTNTEPLEVSAWSKEQESIKKIVAYVKVSKFQNEFFIHISGKTITS